MICAAGCSHLYSIELSHIEIAVALGTARLKNLANKGLRYGLSLMSGPKQLSELSSAHRIIWRPPG